jgi:molybdopterin molybdotransferase
MTGVNKFAKPSSFEDALHTLISICKPLPRTSMIRLEYADDRVISYDIVAPRDHPHYNNCQMDGYALRAADSKKGMLLKPATGDSVEIGTYKPVHTGSVLPLGADAVIKKEDTDQAAEGIIVWTELRPGENVIRKGKVVRKGDIVHRAGKLLKPTDICVLAKLGFTEVEVYDKPRILVIPTGDELLGIGEEPAPGFVIEGNGLMCSMLARRWGCEADIHETVGDNLDILVRALKGGMGYDLIVTSGGTSVGIRDLMEKAVDSTGKVLIHGVAVKPGRPMGIGYAEDDGRRVPVVFLPGVPEACAMTMLAFVCPAVRRLGHYPVFHAGKEKAILSTSLRCSPGSLSFSKLRVENGRAWPVPLMGDSSGSGEYAYAIMGEKSDGYEKGEEIELLFLE